MHHIGCSCTDNRAKLPECKVVPTPACLREEAQAGGNLLCGGAAGRQRLRSCLQAAQGTAGHKQGAAGGSLGHDGGAAAEHLLLQGRQQGRLLHQRRQGAQVCQLRDDGGGCFQALGLQVAALGRRCSQRRQTGQACCRRLCQRGAVPADAAQCPGCRSLSALVAAL